MTTDAIGALLVRSDRRTLAMQADVPIGNATSTTTRPGPTLLTITEHAPPAPERPPVSRRGLIGMGVAGGLVPSPSALIVLLSAIALGRTAFGVLLVIGYGAGMAATLTIAGLLLVRVRDRLRRHAGARWNRGTSAAHRWTTVAPYLTATLVLVVGLGIAVRGLAGT